jgi:hypothetical protein
MPGPGAAILDGKTEVAVLRTERSKVAGRREVRKLPLRKRSPLQNSAIETVGDLFLAGTRLAGAPSRDSIRQLQQISIRSNLGFSFKLLSRISIMGSVWAQMSESMP